MFKVKFLFLLENAWKNLVRTKELRSTFAVLFILAVTTFSLLKVVTLLNQTIAIEMTKAIEEGRIMLLNFNHQLLFIRILRVTVIIGITTLVFVLTNHAQTSFKQIALMQRQDFLTMSFLGEKIELISLEFALQPFFSLLICLSSALLTSLVVISRLFKNISSNSIFNEAINHYSLSLSWDFLIILFILLIVPFVSYRYLHRFLFTSS